MASLQTLASNPMPFDSFCKLVTQLGQIRPLPINTARPDRSRREVLLEKWINNIKNQFASDSGQVLPDGTILLFFRLMFPEEHVRRRYQLREPTLAPILGQYLGLSSKACEAALACDWSRPSTLSADVKGCLGLKVQKYWHQEPRTPDVLTMGRVDELLDELASKSSYSAKEVRQAATSSPSRPAKDVLRDLFDPLGRAQAPVIIQIILRDLSPVLYPLPTTSSDAALLNFNANAHERMTAQQVMTLWSPYMPNLYRIKADIDSVAWDIECAFRAGVDPDYPLPSIGTPVLCPRTNKPQAALSESCKYLEGLTAVETKYDGERVQVHVDLSRPIESQIQIFSKSLRDSTTDRYRLIPIIRASLGLSVPSVNEVRSWFNMGPRNDDSDALAIEADKRVDPRLANRSLQVARKSHLKFTRIIIEGEMIAWREEDEWTKAGAMPYYYLNYAKSGSFPEEDTDDAESHVTGETVLGHDDEFAFLNPLHLHVVYFDILLLDEMPLLDSPFEDRRRRLHDVVHVIDGYTSFPDAVDIDFSRRRATEDLRLRFAQIITERQEGLMLKPLSGLYNDTEETRRWLKVKKDFIPGCGDMIDVNILGASWRRDRGRDLNVPTTTYTTFFMGFRAPDPPHKPRVGKPHYIVLSVTSYGYQSSLDRPRLFELNARIKDEEHENFAFGVKRQVGRQSICGDFRRIPSTVSRRDLDVYVCDRCPFTFSLAVDLSDSSEIPWTIFKTPRIFEVVGAGFQKEKGSEFYALRWPRIVKVDRADGDPVDLESLQKIAERAMFQPDDDESGKGLGQEQLEWLAKLRSADRVSVAGNEESLGKKTSDDEAGDEDEHRSKETSFSTSSCTGAIVLGPHDKLKSNQVDPKLKRSSVDHDGDDKSDGGKRSRLDPPTSSGASSSRTESSGGYTVISSASSSSQAPSSSPVTSRAAVIFAEYDAEHPNAPPRSWAWSIYPKPHPKDASVGLPGLTDLKLDNYFGDALTVIYAAGWNVRDYPYYPHSFREGVIYIDSVESINHLKELSNLRPPRKDRKRVWFVPLRFYGVRTGLRSLLQSNQLLDSW